MSINGGTTMTGNEFREYRKNVLGLTQMECGDKLGLSKSTMRKIEQADMVDKRTEYALRFLLVENKAKDLYTAITM